MKFRKLNKIIHRDLGYIFTGMILIYALSGIALNHKHDWNPNYIIKRFEYKYALANDEEIKSQALVNSLLSLSNTIDEYKKHYYPDKQSIRIFLRSGSVLSWSASTQILTHEQIKKRPLFSSINFLHYNPGKLWKYFSDIFAFALILITISGIIILKGKNGIKFRGAILIGVGIIIPIVFFFLY
jgi:hypothetical protein